MKPWNMSYPVLTPSPLQSHGGGNTSACITCQVGKSEVPIRTKLGEVILEFPNFLDSILHTPGVVRETVILQRMVPTWTKQDFQTSHGHTPHGRCNPCPSPTLTNHCGNRGHWALKSGLPHCPLRIQTHPLVKPKWLFNLVSLFLLVVPLWGPPWGYSLST